MDKSRPATWFLGAFAGALLVGMLMLGAVSHYADSNSQDFNASIQTQNPDHG